MSPVLRNMQVRRRAGERISTDLPARHSGKDSRTAEKKAPLVTLFSKLQVQDGVTCDGSMTQSRHAHDLHICMLEFDIRVALQEVTCSAIMTWEDATMGSMTVWGMAAWPPRPFMVTWNC